MSDPNTPTAPGDADQGTGSGGGLGEPGTTTPSTPPAEDQAGTSEGVLFTDAQIAAAAPAEQDRMRGMVAKFTKEMQSIAKQKEANLAEREALLSERERVNQAETEAPSQASQSRLDKLLENPNMSSDAKSVIRELVEGVREELRGGIDPVIQATKQNRAAVELAQTQGKFRDFHQVVTEHVAKKIFAESPQIGSWDAVYKLAKFDALASEQQRTKAELTKYQKRAGEEAATERPSGPPAERLDTGWFDKMPAAERRKLSSYQIAQMNKRQARGT
jgi:hypothetical protein